MAKAAFRDILPTGPASWIKSISVSALALTASGCSSISQDGFKSTNLGGSISQMWSNVFTGQLRPAPQAQYVFGSDDATLNTQQLIKRLSAQAKRHSSSRYVQPQSPARARAAFESAVPQSRIRPVQSQPVIEPQLPDREIYQKAAQQNEVQGTQDIGETLSYVKIGGGSQISDWQACEENAGSYFTSTHFGFSVKPEFDSCMRAKGYKPEQEADAELGALAGGPA